MKQIIFFISLSGSFILYTQSPDTLNEHPGYIQLIQTKGIVLVFDESPSTNERNVFSQKMSKEGLHIINTEDPFILLFQWEIHKDIQVSIDICKKLAREGFLSDNKNLKYCEPDLASQIEKQNPFDRPPESESIKENEILQEKTAPFKNN